MKPSPEIISTHDGSNSLFLPELNETYHSIHGAIAESRHVFLLNGLERLMEALKSLKVLEVGFGTGLNAMLAAQWSRDQQVHLDYHTLEKYPLAIPLIQQLNYGETLKDPELYLQLHQVNWGTIQTIHPFFSIRKEEGDLIEIALESDFDVVFFDAFAPNKQAEMWGENIFRKIYQSMKKGALLTTYCAQGAVKRTLKSVGFTVEACPGPPGKREMTLAWK